MILNNITLKCVDLTKAFGGIHALDHVNFNFKKGKITALVGPNGAGKTTLFHLITGMIRPDRGEIIYRNKRINNLPSWKIAKLGIGRLFQDVRIFSGLSSIENILLSCQDQFSENPLRSLLWKIFDRKKEKHLINEARTWLDFVGLKEHDKTQAENLSYGQQKLLAIARLLAMGSDILLLDEPTSGVHPEMIKRLLEIIRKLAYDKGKTVVVIEHNISVVIEVADWMFFMDEGKIEASGFPEEVLSNPEVRAAYIGL